MISKLFCFTVDVEMSYPNAEDGVYHFLELFKAYNIRSTFFFTVEALNYNPEIAELVINDGHEVASHGFTHYKAIQKIPTKKASAIYYLTKDRLEFEIEQSYKPFADKGFNVKGFRAPSLIITDEALRILPKYFKYDSSMEYAQSNSNAYANTLKELKKNIFFEIPVSNLRIMKLRFGSPVFLRLSNVVHLLESYIGFSHPLVFYSHSYDYIAPLLTSLKKHFWKKWWYHKVCGESVDIFYRKFIEGFLQKGYQFLTCSRLADLLIDNEI